MQRTPMYLLCSFIKNVNLELFESRLKLLNADIGIIKKLLVYMANNYAQLRSKNQNNSFQTLYTDESGKSSLKEINSTKQLQTQNEFYFENLQRTAQKLNQNEVLIEFSDSDLQQQGQVIQSNKSSASQQKRQLGSNKNLTYQQSIDQQMKIELRKENEELKQKVEQLENLLKSQNISIIDDQTDPKNSRIRNQQSFRIHPVKYTSNVNNQFQQQSVKEKQPQNHLTMDDLLMESEELTKRVAWLQKKAQQNKISIQEEIKEQNQDIKEESQKYDKIIVEINEKYLLQQTSLIDGLNQYVNQTKTYRTLAKLKHQNTFDMITQLQKEWAEIHTKSQNFQNDIKNYLDNLKNDTQNQLQSFEHYSREFAQYKDEIQQLKKKIKIFIDLLKQKMSQDNDNKGKLYMEVITLLTFNISILEKTQYFLNQLMKQIEAKDKQLLEQQELIASKVEEQNQQFEKHSIIVTNLLKHIENQDKLFQIMEEEDQKFYSKKETQDIKNQLLGFLENALMNSHQIFNMKNEECIKQVEKFRKMDIATQKQLQQMMAEMIHHMTTLSIQFQPEGESKNYIIYQQPIRRLEQNLQIIKY